MKLYTELEIRKAIKADNWTHSENEILSKLTPIELPSDEEIQDKSYNEFTQSNARTCFEAGAHWLKKQILNQNK